MLRAATGRHSLAARRLFSTTNARLFASKRLRPDPDKVPRSEPINLSDEAFRKTNTIEDYTMYDVEPPPNNVDTITSDGFVLANGARITSSAESPLGLILIGHEAYQVDLSNSITGLDSGRVEIDVEKVMGVFQVVNPKPELLVLGLGGKSRILGPKTQSFIRQLGMQTQIGTTLHGASYFDLLATERGKSVAGFLLPPNM